MQYGEWSLAGASCPAGYTMGSGHDMHAECDMCPDCVYRICGGMCRAGDET